MHVPDDRDSQAAMFLWPIGDLNCLLANNKTVGFDQDAPNKASDNHSQQREESKANFLFPGWMHFDNHNAGKAKEFRKDRDVCRTDMTISLSMAPSAADRAKATTPSQGAANHKVTKTRSVIKRPGKPALSESWCLCVLVVTPFFPQPVSRY